MLHELIWNLKKIIGSVILLCATRANHFLIGLWYVMKSGFCITGDDQLSGWNNKELQSTPQSQTCTKKRSWSLFGGLLPVWYTIILWILAKPLHLRSMLRKSIRCTANCNACSWHQSTEGVAFSTTAPNHMLHNQHFKSWMNWAMKLYLISHTHLTSCWLPLLQAYRQCFAGRTLPQPVGCRKCFPEFVKFQSIDFLRWKNKQPYFSLAKMCWL